jgi:predicted ATPase
MALPKIGIPYYTLELISGKNIQYRPFTVKEEKALLIANESKDKNAVSNAIRNTLNACILQEENKEKIEIESLPMFDIEYLFLNIRIKSVGETSEFNYTCDECEGSPVVKTKIDLRKVKVENEKNGDNQKIMLNDSVGVELQYPPFSVFLGKNMVSTAGETDPLMAIDMISDCIVTVYDEKQVYTRKDFTDKEIKDFVDSLTQEQLKKINNFFENMPKLVYDLEVECPCGTVSKKKLQGISDFFS